MRANPGRAGPLSLAAIVSRLGGRVAGNPDTVVSQVGSLENAASGDIAFYSNPRYRTKLQETGAGAVVLPPSAESLTTLPRIVTENPYAYFAHLSRLFNPDSEPSPGVHADALVDRTAIIASSAQIGPGAAIFRTCYQIPRRPTWSTRLEAAPSTRWRCTGASSRV